MDDDNQKPLLEVDGLKNSSHTIHQENTYHNQNTYYQVPLHDAVQQQRTADLNSKNQESIAQNSETQNGNTHVRDTQTNEPKRKLFKGKIAIESVPAFLKFFFNWAYPFVKASNQDGLSLEQYGELRDDDMIEKQQMKIRNSWNQFKTTKSENALIKAVFHAYRWDYLFALFLNLIGGTCEFMAPFLINLIIQYIETPDEEVYWGIIYVVALIITQTINYLFFQHIIYQQVMIGVHSVNSLVVLIYEKLFKISPATNKQFSQGEIVNFIQVDAEVLFMISFDMPTMIKFPLILVTSIAFLFYYLGLSFFAGIGVILFGFFTNLILGLINATLWRGLMKKKDARMNATAETLQSIKMIKLYGWNETFLNRINQKRSEELKSLKKAFFFTCLIITCMYLFPQLLSPVVFTTYIGTGNKIDIKTTYTIIVFFNMIKDPLRFVPEFFGELVETIVSMKRVQKFLQSDEVNPTIIRHHSSSKSGNTKDSDKKIDFETDLVVQEYSVKISNGNFSWGFPFKKEEDEDNEENVSDGKASQEKDKKKTQKKKKSKKDKKRKEKSKAKAKVQDQDLNQLNQMDGILEEDLLLEKEAQKNETKIGDLNELKDSQDSDDQQELKKIEDLITLKNIDLQIKKGEFITIIGEQDFLIKFLNSVGSGKSSLLSALIGDMLYFDEEIINNHGGREKIMNEEEQKSMKDDVLTKVHQNAPIQIYGSLSYVQQQPWIQNMTIRDNILFGQPFDEVRYKQVIKDCELERDLEILPASDFTEIGEKGINLSGGQKARVSLARAVYAQKDIVLMDDPISALDANVRKKIFQNVIMKQFHGKTRILVTHAIDFLKLTDRIIIMKNGEIAAIGTYDELEENEHLKETVKIHAKNNENHNKGSQDIKVSDQDMNDPSQKNIDLLNTEVDLKAGVRAHIQTVITEDRMTRTTYIGDNNAHQMNGDKMDQQQSEKEQRLLNQGRILEDEEKEIIKVQPSSYKQLLQLAGGWKLITLVNFAMILFVGSQIYSDYLLGQWSQTLGDESKKDDFYFYTYTLFGMAFLSGITAFTRTCSMQFFSLSASKQMHKKMIARIIQGPINLFFDVTPIGRILNRFSKDLTTFDTELAFTLSTAVVCFYGLIGTLVVSSIAVYWIIIPIPFMLIILFKIFIFTLNGFREASRIESITKSPLISYLSETVFGISTIRSFDIRDDFVKRNFVLLNKNILANQIGVGLECWVYVRLDFITIGFMALACSFCIIFKTHSDPIMLGLLLTYILGLTDNIVYLLYLLSQTERKMVSIQRCFNILDVPQENFQSVEQTEIFKNENPQWPVEGKVQFKDVVLRYRPQTEVVLNTLSFEVKPGEKVGIVGRTGAGKSTISLALTRIVELEKGAIIIDGKDTKDVSLEYLRQKITIIPQDPTLFRESLRFNLDPETRNSDERIKELLTSAGLESLLTRDEKGLDMQIEESGSNLSSGEKQLICICRAILRKNKIVLLDEATANIDVVTEQQIQKLINEEFKESTVITIAHRLNTIIKSDRVLVLSYGQLLEYDSPQNLMNDSTSEFYKLLQELKKEEEEQNKI